MDPLFHALSLFRRRKFEKAITECDKILSKNAFDQSAWCLKLRCLTEQVYVDEVENEEEGIAEALLDDNTMTRVPRPGTSLQKPNTSAGSGAPSQSIRPRTQTGRPVSGVVRPGTQGGRPGTMEQALKTPRTSKTARPVTSSSGRYVRLGTASMLSNPDGPFVNVSRLNFSKYAGMPNVAKPLFEYLFFHENDVRNALQLASLATQFSKFDDWYWKMALGKCYHRLGLFRDAEKQFRSALAQEPLIDTYLYLGKVYIRLDQPITAIDIYKQGLEKFPNDTDLLTGLARIYEGMNNLAEAVDHYKLVLKQDSTNIEAIACMGTNHFYSDQPEIALRYYRRLLQMGVNNAEIFANIGLCCFYSQQYDMALSCLQRAISAADGDNTADIWYNIGLVALATGDTSMAFQSFRLAISANSDHAESFCNLGVLELRKGNRDSAKSYLQTAMKLGSYTFEPAYNYALLLYQTGEFQSCYTAVTKALDIFPEHSDSIELKKRVSQHLTVI